MADPVCLSVELHGTDPELQALNAVVQLLEDRNYYVNPIAARPLNANERARIARYLVDRYPLTENREA